jgi:hypothetical protein
MKKTLNNLNTELQAIADAHLQVNTYYWGDFLNAINQDKAVTYPLMCCFVTGNSLEKVTIPVTINIIVADKFFKNGRQGNLNDTESDTLQVVRDVYEVISKSPRWQNIGKITGATASKFLEKGADESAGWILAISFTIYDNQSICNLPMMGYDFETSANIQMCEDVIIINSDGSFTHTAASGDVYTLPDTTYNVYVNSNLNSTFTIPTLS